MPGPADDSLFACAEDMFYSARYGSGPDEDSLTFELPTRLRNVMLSVRIWQTILPLIYVSEHYVARGCMLQRHI